MTLSTTFVALASSRAATTESFSPVTATCSVSAPGGRGTIDFLTVAAAGAALILTSAAPANAVISAPECFSGYGPGCDASAAEAPIVKELLERSRANKEKNDRDTLESYWQNGYRSYFSFGYDRELIRADDGTYSLKRPESMIAKTLSSFGIKVPSHGGRD